VDTEWRTDEIWIQNSGIRTSLVNIRRLRRRDEGKYFDVAAPHGRAAVSKAMQRTHVSVGSVTTAAAKCVRSDRDHYRIIVSYRLSR